MQNIYSLDTNRGLEIVDYHLSYSYRGFKKKYLLIFCCCLYIPSSSHTSYFKGPISAPKTVNCGFLVISRSQRTKYTYTQWIFLDSLQSSLTGNERQLTYNGSVAYKIKIYQIRAQSQTHPDKCFLTRSHFRCQNIQLLHTALDQVVVTTFQICIFSHFCLVFPWCPCLR